VALAFILSRASERNALIHYDVIADYARFAYYHAHTVIDKYARAYLRAGVNFHTGKKLGYLAYYARGKKEPVRMENMRYSIPKQRVKA
jgi:hypothetical protein